MKVINYTTNHTSNYKSLNNAAPLKKGISPNAPTSTAPIEPSQVKLSRISFGAIHGVKLRKVNIIEEKRKLIRLFDEILQSDVPEIDKADQLMNNIKKLLSQYRIIMKKKEQTMEKLAEIESSKVLSTQQKLEAGKTLLKEWKQIQNQNKNISKVPPKPLTGKDERINCNLINKFKNAVSEDNFDLRKVFKEFYRELNEIKTVQELNELFPKIKTPKNPKQVIAKKIADVLTRDFYEKYDELIAKGNTDNVINFVHKKLAEMVGEFGEKCKFSPVEVIQSCIKDVHAAIGDRYLAAKLDKGFSCIPEVRKVKAPQITQNDTNLLSVNFDDFVVSTVKKHYLEGKKLNEITYTNGKVTINASALQEAEYKFEKMPEKVKAFLNTGDLLRAAQRDYENFTPAEFKARLSLYANSPIADNEKILEKIMDFDSCKFKNEDNVCLAKFLRELDEVADEKKPIEDALKKIKDLTPKDTERLNEIEKKQAATKFRFEQQKLFELKQLRGKFDEAISLLYDNDLNSLAATCSKYRPEKLTPQSLEDTEYLIGLINKEIKNAQDGLINKDKVQNAVLRWDTYNFYMKNDPQNPAIKEALAYAQEAGGSLNKEKAGKYIINSEIIQNYPQSREILKSPEVLDKIMEKSSQNQEACVRGLCKLDDYAELSAENKTKLSKITELFDLAKPAEKSVLKHIIENNYVNTDTKVPISLKENGGEAITGIFSSKAKQQILEKYKFPLCLTFLQDFEEALGSYATKRGSSGIKKAHTEAFKIELKLKNHDDRLFSSNNDYCFDVFSERGLH